MRLRRMDVTAGKGKITEEITHPINDEIGSLAKSFNRMQISLKKAMELLKRGRG